MAVNSDRVVKTSFGRGLYLLSVFWVRDDNNNNQGGVRSSLPTKASIMVN